jgi:hypothetical protein
MLMNYSQMKLLIIFPECPRCYNYKFMTRIADKKVKKGACNGSKSNHGSYRIELISRLHISGGNKRDRNKRKQSLQFSC